MLLKIMPLVIMTTEGNHLSHSALFIKL
jgi:hypothetical protein